MFPKNSESIVGYYQPFFKSPIDVYVAACKSHTGSLRCNIRIRTTTGNSIVDELSIDILRTESPFDKYKLKYLKEPEITVGGYTIIGGSIEKLKESTDIRVVDLDE